ncbi:polysaccharide lyase [Actinokineospora sp.]|uniref:polysaccharide lyase n=1 Tax=Actinokineospora sp. TaxID=1872133 RepID=UPI0040382CC8
MGDYSTGNFAQWSNVQKKGVNSPASGFSGDAGLNLVTPAQGGHPRFANSAKFTVNDGDVPPFGGGERAELRAGNAADVREGDERWYEFSLKFDSTFKNPVGDWFIVAQWHSSSGSPPIAVSVDRDGNLEVSGNRPDNNYSRNIGPVVRGQWVDYVVHVKFSNSASTGFVEVHQNGALAVPKFSTRTMASDSNYFKMGIYRDGDETNKAIVSNAGLRITKP